MASLAPQTKTHGERLLIFALNMLASGYYYNALSLLLIYAACLTLILPEPITAVHMFTTDFNQTPVSKLPKATIYGA